MSTRANDVLGIVHADGSLELAGKLTVPPGRVRVRVASLEPQPPPAENLGELIDRVRWEMAAAGSHFMDNEEVTAWIEELRAVDDRIEGRDRQFGRPGWSPGVP